MKRLFNPQQERFKFRAWLKKENRMITHSQAFLPLLVTSLGVLRLSATHEDDVWYLLPTEEYELMQSTGLKDKWNTEIYEGDIVRDSANRDWSATVEWSDTGFSLSKIGPGERDLWELYERDRLEVIGNIHED